jgi:hypothetical protein
MRRSYRWGWLAGLAIMFVFDPDPASAFVLTNGRPFDNVSSAGARAPGVLVGAGLSRTVSQFDYFQSVHNITQTSVPPDFTDLFLPQWIDTIFGQINSALDLLINTLFLRAGQTPPGVSQPTGATATTTGKVIASPPHSLVNDSLNHFDRGAR